MNRRLAQGTRRQRVLLHIRRDAPAERFEVDFERSEAGQVEPDLSSRFTGGKLPAPVVQRAQGGGQLDRAEHPAGEQTQCRQIGQ